MLVISEFYTIQLALYIRNYIERHNKYILSSDLCNSPSVLVDIVYMG